jgi:hypothetical protein
VGAGQHIEGASMRYDMLCGERSAIFAHTNHMWLVHHLPFQWVGGEQRSRFQINHRSANGEAHNVRDVLLEDGKRERQRHTLQTSSIPMRVIHGYNIQSMTLSVEATQ